MLATRPFTGAEACVIGLRNAEPERMVLVDPKVKIDPSVLSLPPGVARRIPPLTPLRWKSSSYARQARNGATIFPAVLVRIDPADPSRTQQPKRSSPPWSEWKPFALDDVPARWRVGYIGPRNLAPFTIAGPLSEAILPNDADGLLSDADARALSATWRLLSSTYERHAGKGGNTPKTLADNLNYGGKLAKQWPPSLSVVYNGSGQHLRAALARDIIEHACYRVPVESEEEGLYLVAVLNAPCLAFAFRFARKTDRHFDKTPLEKVPISRFNPQNPNHCRLAELSAAISDALRADPGREYPAGFAAELREIDSIVGRMLPDFVKPVEDYS